MSYSGPPKMYLNPTLILFLFLILILAAVNVAYFNSHIPIQLAFFANFLCLYYLYTPVHEAAHNIAHKYKSINKLIGTVGAFIMGMNFQSYRLAHLYHHRRPNHKSLDPDAILQSRSPIKLFPKLIFRLLYDHIFLLKQQAWKLKPKVFKEYLLALIFQVLLISSLILMGFSQEILLLWLLPATLSGMSLFLTFAYLVHHPHSKLGESKNINNIVLRIIMLGQSMHKIHHKNAAIPWYLYSKIDSKNTNHNFK